MAAVTVEDCLKVLPNRFELALVASYRAKALMNGAPALYVSEKVEKNTVVALREIGANLLDIESIKDEIKNDIKDKALFKNYKDDPILSEKKDLDIESSSADDLADDLSDDSDSEDISEEDDEEYYDNLDDDSTVDSGLSEIDADIEK